MGTHRIVLDSGALSALAGKKEKIRRVIERAIETQTDLLIPAVVVAESTTGTFRDAAVNRCINAFGMAVVPVSESLARSAGALRFAAARRPLSDTIDAIVVATGDLAERSVIVTGDLTDLQALAAVTRRSRIIGLE